MGERKRILIVEVNWVGDVLFSTAAIRNLRVRYPESFIACLVHRRCKEVIVGNPHIDEIISLDEAGYHRGLIGKLRLICLLRQRDFDTVFLFHRSLTRTLLCILSGIRNRIGYVTTKRKFLLTERINVPTETMHRAAYYLYLVTKTVTNDKETLRSDFFIDDSDKEYLNNILSRESIKAEDRIVVIHPAGNWFAKRWPKRYFAQLADALIDKYKVTVVFSGAQKEGELVEDILSTMQRRATNLSGKTSLKQLGALFERANLVVSADSGPLHIAVALGRPTVALFGPTSQAITGPLTERNIAALQKEIDCVIPCYRQDCEDNYCMEQIAAEDVLKCIEGNGWLK